jgi:hypothetical protein
LIELVKMAYREMAGGEASGGGGKPVESEECVGDSGIDDPGNDVGIENLEVGGSDSLCAFQE